jgi:hypothetical protein
MMVKENIEFVKRAIHQYFKSNQRKPGAIVVSTDRFKKVADEMSATDTSLLEVEGVHVKQDNTLEFESSVLLDKA